MQPFVTNRWLGLLIFAAPLCSGFAVGALELGLPLLPTGEELMIEAPGWGRGYGTGGQVWPAAGSIARLLLEEQDALQGATVLELGSGTGALGIFAAAALQSPSATLSDASLGSLRQQNAALNAAHYAPGAKVDVTDFSFGDDLGSMEADLVLASDVTYDSASHADLCSTLSGLLLLGTKRVLLAHQHRPLASFLGGESVLEHLEETAEGNGLRLELRCRDSLFAPVDVFENGIERHHKIHLESHSKAAPKTGRGVINQGDLPCFLTPMALKILPAASRSK